MNDFSLLKSLRLKRNLSLRRLSSFIDVDYSDLSKYERRIVKPDILTVMKISKFFNYSIIEFLFDFGYKESELFSIAEFCDIFQNDLDDPVNCFYDCVRSL